MTPALNNGDKTNLNSVIPRKITNAVQILRPPCLRSLFSAVTKKQITQFPQSRSIM